MNTIYEIMIKIPKDITDFLLVKIRKDVSISESIRKNN